MLPADLSPLPLPSSSNLHLHAFLQVELHTTGKVCCVFGTGDVSVGGTSLGVLFC